MMKRTYRMAVAMVAALGLLGTTACGGSNDSDTGGDDGLQTVTFWHSMTGVNGEVLDGLISDFNKQNEGKIKVEGVFQGKYDDALTKYKSSIKSKSTPTLMQIYDIGSRFMMDSGTIAPMQDFIDDESFDTSEMQPNVLGYYQVDNKLYSMPFNTSMPVLYYNKDLFEKAGLDPDKAPETLDEVKEAAEKLSSKNGGPAEYGFNAAIYGWFLEQEIAANGELYCSPDNGRGSERATKFTYDNDAAAEFMTWWKDMVDSGISGNTGTDTDAAKQAFQTGTVGITLESTADLAGMMEGAKEKGFEVGVGYYPKIETNDSGPIIGGASLWISNLEHSDAEQKAAWEFVKFLSTADSQATWHTGTGYFPTSKAALETDLDTKWREEHPQFDVAVQQLENTKLTPATQGCSAGVMPQARKSVETAVEKIFQGTDAKTALSDQVKAVQTDLDDYNSSVE